MRPLDAAEHRQQIQRHRQHHRQFAHRCYSRGSARPEKPLAQCQVGTDSSDVSITIDPTKGPLGSAQPRPINNGLWSTNIWDEVRVEYYPTILPRYAKYLAATKPRYLRWPAGWPSQNYKWSRTAPTVDSDPFKSATDNYLTPALVDAFVALCQQVGAEPYLGVNIRTDSPAVAADFVHYVNVEKGYNVHYFQLDNEPDFDIHGTPDTYAPLYVPYAQAIRGVDRRQVGRAGSHARSRLDCLANLGRLADALYS